MALAGYVGASPDNLAFATNASSAINAAARSLQLEQGDEVLMGDDEYGGMRILWDYVCARSGAHVVQRPFDELEPGPRTKVIFCSHIEWSSGRVNDVARLCRRAREAGVLTIVDGAHAPGQIELDLELLGADVYAGNCHKWMCAPKGSGFLHAHPDAQRLIDPLIVSWDWGDGAAFHERHRWQGTRDPSAFLAVQDAIAFLAANGWGVGRGTLPPSRSRRPRSRSSRSRTSSCRCAVSAWSTTTRPLFKQRLYDEHRIEVPVFETRHGWVLRVSVQAYNDAADLEVLVSALGEST